MESRLRSLGLLAMLVVLTTCGGGSSTSVGISLSPTSSALHPGDVTVFSATVTGSGNTAVTWTVQEGAAGGSVDSSGVYTAPPNDGVFHVVATSQADTGKTATAAIVVTGSFSISPTSDVLGPSGVQDFAASVEVTWSVQEGAAGGAIAVGGTYTAPAAAGAYHVVATSVQNPAMTSTAVVTVVASGFVPTGDMSVGRTAHTATVLQGGKVLIAGGSSCYFSSYYFSDNCPLDSAELYDPATGTFTVTGTMTVKRTSHTATLLKDGRVLVAGGSGASAELYDPATGKFAATGSMSTGRSNHTATLLNDGKVLIVGGSGVNAQLATAELYDPATGNFTATGSLNEARTNHSASLLADGRVLIAGGFLGRAPRSSAELYDPATGMFSAAGMMTSARTNFTATVLANSNVLLTGGDDAHGTVATAEVYDATSGSFTSTGQMKLARVNHVAALLANGSVLVAGSDATAELYDATAGTFSQTGGMRAARQLAAAALLQDGRVLVTGGSDTSSAELYQ
jgi:hypothetical protein